MCHFLTGVSIFEGCRKGAKNPVGWVTAQSGSEIAQLESKDGEVEVGIKAISVDSLEFQLFFIFIFIFKSGVLLICIFIN